jgi:hypothetical protein
VIDFAKAFPYCNVIGIDLSSIQPTEGLPSNCSFAQANMTADWTFGTAFDFIHTRALAGGIADWNALISKCFANLKPGGWIELHEIGFPLYCDDGSASPDSAVLRWGEHATGAMKKVGINGDDCLYHAERLYHAGFVNVHEIHGKWTVGPWAKGEQQKHVGELFRKDLVDGIYGITAKIFPGLLGWNEADLKDFMDGVVKEMQDPNVRNLQILVVS